MPQRNQTHNTGTGPLEPNFDRAAEVTPKVTLRPYQVPVKNKAIEILQRFGFCYLVMYPRTGKTATSFSIFEHLGAKHINFITTKGAKPGIREAFEIKSPPSFTMDLFHYDELPKLIKENYQPKSEFIAVDEGHLEGAFPEPSIRAKLLKEFILQMFFAYGERVKILFLSATPSPEDFVQLYHQFNVLGHNNPLGPIDSFIDHYVHVTDEVVFRNPQPPIKFKTYKAKDAEVLQLISKYCISLTQEQAGFKVKPHDEFHPVMLKTNTYMYIYNLSNNNKVILPNGIEVVSGKAAKLKSKIHQLCGGTLKYEYKGKGNKKVKDFIILDDSKAQYIKQKFAGQKIAIYYQFKAELELLKQVFPTWTDDHNLFNASGPEMVYLGQFKSKREGVDLNTADVLVAYNIDYAALSYWQFRQRHNHQERQTPAPVAWIQAINGIETYIFTHVSKKETYHTSYFEHDLTFIKKSNPNQLSLFA